MERIDYEKMALALIEDGFSSKPPHCRIADALQERATAAARAQREACYADARQMLYDAVARRDGAKSTLEQGLCGVECEVMRKMADRIHETPLITDNESEAKDAD